MALSAKQSRLLRHHAQQRLIPSPPSLLSDSMPSYFASPEMSSSDSSASPSPTLEGQHYFSQISPPAFALPRPQQVPSAMPRKSSSKSASKVAPIPEDESLEEFELRSPTTSEEESKLYDVNAEIKSTLMELLNTEAVRHDGKMRQWIQSKLMEAEMELKKQRRHNSGRRRSSTPRIVLTPSNEMLRRSETM